MEGVTRPDGAAAQITSRLITRALERAAVRRQYQRSCTWTLYGRGCKAARTIQGTPTPSQVGTNAIRLGHAWNGGFPKAKYKGGYISWRSALDAGTHVRTILDIHEGSSSDVLLLSGDTHGLGAGTPINLFLGCNHQTDDCRELHNNLVNFGGQPWIPKQNPVGGVNRYY